MSVVPLTTPQASSSGTDASKPGKYTNRFTKGNAPRGGRKKGSLNKATREGQALAQKLVTDPAYLKALRLQLINRTLNPHMERTLWEYAWGLPKQKLSLDVNHNHELGERAAETLRSKVERLASRTNNPNPTVIPIRALPPPPHTNGSTST